MQIKGVEVRVGDVWFDGEYYRRVMVVGKKPEGTSLIVLTYAKREIKNAENTNIIGAEWTEHEMRNMILIHRRLLGKDKEGTDVYEDDWVESFKGENKVFEAIKCFFITDEEENVFGWIKMNDCIKIPAPTKKVTVEIEEKHLECLKKLGIIKD